MKYIFWLCLLLVVNTNLKGQQDTAWAPSGATWVYGSWGGGGILHYFKIAYTKDTILLGQHVKQMALSKISYLAPYGVPIESSAVITDMGFDYMYNHNDTVFRYDNTAFRSFYLLNPALGDSWVIHGKEGVSHPCHPNDSTDLAVVDSIYYKTTPNGYTLKMIRAKSDEEQWSHWDINTTGKSSLFIDKIGSIRTPYALPIRNAAPPQGTNICSTYGHYFNTPKDLSCYQDSIRGKVDINLYPYCDQLLSTNTQNIVATSKQLLFKVFPNPVQDYMTIEPIEYGQYDIEIYDMMGRVIHEENNLVGIVQFNTLTYPKGMYILKLYLPSIGYQIFKFIKQ